MAAVLKLDEKAERKHLRSIFELLLGRSFDGRSEFDHMYMSAGEGLAHSLDHLKVIKRDGPLIFLTMSEKDVLRKIEQAPLSALPALSDMLDVLLTFLGQYGTVPKLTDPFQFAHFDEEVATLLKDMRLLDNQHVAHRSFWIYLVDHHFLMPAQGGWNVKVREALRQVCDMTWANPPEEFKAIVEGRSDRPDTWAEGFMRQRWRHGRWLTPQEQARAIGSHHAFLPAIVVRTLMDGRKDVYVPAKFLQGK